MKLFPGVSLLSRKDGGVLDLPKWPADEPPAAVLRTLLMKSGKKLARDLRKAGMQATMMARFVSMMVHMLLSMDCHMLSVRTVARSRVVKRRMDVMHTLDGCLC